jgi:hypothetical protein
MVNRDGLAAKASRLSGTAGLSGSNVEVNSIHAGATLVADKLPSSGVDRLRARERVCDRAQESLDA